MNHRFAKIFLISIATIAAVCLLAVMIIDALPMVTAHEGGVDMPSTVEHAIMDTWFDQVKPGNRHWPDGSLDYKIKTAGMPLGWEAEIDTAVREMVAETFIDSITKNASSCWDSQEKLRKGSA